MAPNISSPLRALLVLLVLLPHSMSSEASWVKDGKGGSQRQTFKLPQRPERFQMHYANDDQPNYFLGPTMKDDHRLKTGGALNPPMVKQVMRPRCRIPDISGDAIHECSGKKPYHHCRPGSDHHHSVSRNSHRPPPLIHHTYRIQSDVQVRVWSMYSQASVRWSETNHITITEAQDVITPNIDQGNRDLYDEPRGRAAYAFEPRVGRVYNDADEDWSSGVVRGLMMNPEKVVAPEFDDQIGLRPLHDTIEFPATTAGAGALNPDWREDEPLHLRVLFRYQ